MSLRIAVLWIMVMLGLGVANAAAKGEHDVAAAHYNRGVAWMTRGDRDKAIEAFSEAILSAPRFAAAFRARGNAWYAKGALGRAIEDYGRAIILDPHNPAAFHNRATAFHAAHDDKRAIADYDIAIQLDGENAEFRNGRGIVWQALGDHNRAIRDFDDAIRLDPHLAQAFSNRGVSWRAMGDIDGAIRDFDMAIRLRPRYAIALNNRGAAWRSKRENGHALADFDAAIALDPKFAMALYNRGLTRYWQGQYESAAIDLAKAAAGESPLYAALWLYLALERSRGAGKAELARLVQTRRPSGWPMQAVHFYLGTQTLAGLRHAAAVGERLTRVERQCEAAFYGGQRLLVEGDEGTARDLLVEAESTCPVDFVEYEGAVIELDRMGRSGTAAGETKRNGGSRTPR